ncbi:GNAT family N-acetyltransferase [Terriglobus sp. RCC_193]|uniref:GNAT family N-acetyltransferase n=1 Tax=Terriglobus sp. RCC_193 TaxID=3239218 RepID=UPI003525D256
MRERIHRLAESVDRIAFVAVLENTVVGWADASIERHLQSPDVVELGGLVVAEGHRGLGIGRRLCEAVEAWAVHQEIPRVRVRSQIKRQDAHRFYLRDGYEHIKTSAVFEKRLD